MSKLYKKKIKEFTFINSTYELWNQKLTEKNIFVNSVNIGSQNPHWLQPIHKSNRELRLL